MSEQSDREAIIREIAKKRVVYAIPGMESLPVRRSISYRGNLLMDIYYPEAAVERPVPVVVVPFGYPDPGSDIRMFGPVTSWAQLFAASGMAAVIYGSAAPASDVHAVLAYLREHAAALDLDVQRLALFSMSGSVPVALSVLMDDRAITAAALLCGYTMDLGGSTTIAAMAAQYGFANAAAGRTVDDLPDRVPMLFVRAGRDETPGLNEALDDVLVRALRRNLPLALINHATGLHAFVCDEDSAISRRIVRQILAFLAMHLT